jgi:hypothetical protein
MEKPIESHFGVRKESARLPVADFGLRTAAIIKAENRFERYTKQMTF